MARPSLHEERDHRPCPRREVRRLRRQIEATLFQLGPARRTVELVLVEEPGEGKPADAKGAPGEKMAASEIARLVVHDRVVPYSWLHRRSWSFLQLYFPLRQMQSENAIGDLVALHSGEEIPGIKLRH
jgi:hypothetical protein